jgi:hypothetical protein
MMGVLNQSWSFIYIRRGGLPMQNTSKHGKSIFRNLNLSCSQLGLAQVGLIRRGQT